jgi:hypothetical protein
MSSPGRSLPQLQRPNLLPTQLIPGNRVQVMAVIRRHILLRMPTRRVVPPLTLDRWGSDLVEQFPLQHLLRLHRHRVLEVVEAKRVKS